MLSLFQEISIDAGHVSENALHIIVKGWVDNCKKANEILFSQYLMLMFCTSELENDRQTVEESLFFNSEIRFENFVDSVETMKIEYTFVVTLRTVHNLGSKENYLTNKIQRLFLIASTMVHFTVTVANEAGVDLVLIEPFLLYYVNP